MITTKGYTVCLNSVCLQILNAHMKVTVEKHNKTSDDRVCLIDSVLMSEIAYGRKRSLMTKNSIRVCIGDRKINK